MGFGIRSTGLKLLGVAISVSFLGSLPPGTTNVITVQMVLSNGVWSALRFSLGCLIAEIICVGVCLFTMDRILRYEKVLRLLQVISLAVLIALAVATSITAIGNKPLSVIEWGNPVSPFIFGFFLMIINPVQIPFWLGWTTVLFDKGVLRRTGFHYFLFIAGTALGSLLASLLFIYSGKYFLDNSTSTRTIFQYAAAVFFLISALFQAKKIWRRPLNLPE